MVQRYPESGQVLVFWLLDISTTVWTLSGLQVRLPVLSDFYWSGMPCNRLLIL